MKKIKWLLFIPAFVTLSACTTHVNPEDGAPTMAQAYEKALRADASTTSSTGSDTSNLNAARQKVQTMAVPTQSTMPQAGTIAEQFPMLPNPQLIMYITPHYAGSEQLPVPGYYTVFSLYAQNYYALPGEAQLKLTTGASI